MWTATEGLSISLFAAYFLNFQTIVDEAQLCDFDVNINEICSRFPCVVPRVVGSGLPRSNDITSLRFSELERIAKVVASDVREWCDRNSEFLTTFTSATRAEQSRLAPNWSSNGIEDLADRIRDKVLDILEDLGYGKKYTLGMTARHPSKLRGRLLEALCRLSGPDGSPEDVDVAMQVMHGVSVGHRLPLFERPEVWPSASVDRPLRKGEPSQLRWEVGAGSTPFPRTISDPVMKKLVDDEISAEIQLGRMTVVEVEKVSALTRVSAILKKSSPSAAPKVRLLSDYRRSGVNRMVQCSTTVLLPRLRDSLELIRGVPENWYLAEFDVRAAFRNLPLHNEEVPFLALLDPRAGDKALVDHFLPFGLLSSPQLYCRLGAAVHRVTRRLLSAAFDIPIDDIMSSVYVDDSSFGVPDMSWLVFAIVVTLVVGLPVEFTKVFLGRSDARLQGVGVDLQSRTVFIPVDKSVKISELITKCLNSGRAQVEQLQTLVGKLAWVSQIVTEAKPRLAPLYSLLAVCNREGLRSITLNETSQDSLRYFKCTLSVCTYVKVHDHVFHVDLITDACLEGIGGVVRVSGGETLFYQVNAADSPLEWAKVLALIKSTSSSTLKSGQISSLELVAVYYGVLCIESFTDLSAGCVRCFTDNIATKCALNSWNSGSEVMRAVLKRMSCYAGAIAAAHVSGVDNRVADILSRGTAEGVRDLVPRDWVRVCPQFVL